MRRIARAACLAAAAGLFAACTASPILLEGDANSARVAYSGDLAKARAVAAQHCARYERIPRFVRADIDSADFACVKP